MKIFIFCILFSLNLYAKEVLQIKENVLVWPQEKIHFSDLLFKKDQKKVPAPLLKRVIFEALKNGEKKVISSERLALILRRKGVQEFALHIPQEIHLLAQPFQLKEEAVRSALRKAWSKLCRECRFSFLKLSLPQVPKNFRAHSWRLSPVTTVPRGSFSQKVFISNEKDEKRFFWIQGQVQIIQKVPVATRALSFGTKLKAEDVKWEYRDVTYAVDSVPSSVEGKILKKGLRSKDIIWFSDLKRGKVLHRGDEVKVSIRKSNWVLSLRGVALQDADVGERVRVRIPKTRKVLTAIVSKEGEVVLQ
ncbi:MAG: flagella basal body P-ring formation protein FlgA [Bdellovibrio sp.]|nr:MAG: flagella basal body P-ring formation protein FlgA [Bdellovibrio sp.]